jgi:ankyrin repeat protein
MQAASYGYTDIVDFLLEKGADIHARDSSNLNVIEYTKKLQRRNMQKHLENYLQK